MIHELKNFLASLLAVVLILPLSAISLLVGPSLALAAETDVVINEVLPNPTGSDTGNEKIELYNKGTTTVDISSWTLEDSSTTIHTVPASTSLLAGGYYVATPAGSPLTNSGETVTLKNSSATTIGYSVTYPDLTSPENVSYARKPDGASSFYKDPAPTIGSLNGGVPTPTSLAITPVGGTIVANTLNNTNTNFTASVTIPANEGIVSVELFLDGSPFSSTILDTTISSSDTSATFDAGSTTNSTLQAIIPQGGHNLSARVMVNGVPGGTSSALPILADYTGPSSTVATTGTFGPNTWPGAVTGTASDALSSITSVSLEIIRPDGQNWNGTSWQVGSTQVAASGATSWNYAMGVASFPQDGTYTINSRATDTAGNVESTGTGSFVWDASPPSADPSNLSSEPGINTPTNGKIEVSWANGGTDTPSGVDGYSYSFTQGAADIPDTTKDIEESVNSVASSALTPDGNWYFHIRTVDNAGNWTSTSHYGPFVIDTVAPDVPTLLDPTTDKTVNLDKYTIKGTIEAKATVKIYKDSNNNNIVDPDEIVVATTETTGTGFELEVFLAQDATNFFLVTATDQAGNEGAPADVPAIVEDSQPPSTLTTTSPVSHKIKYDGELVFEGKTDPGAEVTVKIFSLPLKKTTIADAAGLWKIVIKASEVEPGSHRVVITITDLAGNKSQSLLGSFQILSPLPLISEELARAALRAIVPEAKAAPPAEAAAPEGEIKAGVAEEAAARTSRIVTLIALLIIALGIGTAGYYAYSWWAEGTQVKEPIQPIPPEKKKRPRGRPRGRPGRRSPPPSTRW